MQPPTINSPIEPMNIHDSRMYALARKWPPIPADPDLADDLGTRRDSRIRSIADLALVCVLVCVLICALTVFAVVTA